MTPEAQRIAIAEVCGWTEIETVYNEPEPDSLAGYAPNHQPHKRGGLDFVKEEVPWYLSDLNAMHEAEKVLTPEQTNTYRDYLLWIHRPTDYQNGVRVSGAISATAAQRAEAFLRCLDKWEDSK